MMRLEDGAHAAAAQQANDAIFRLLAKLRGDGVVDRGIASRMYLARPAFEPRTTIERSRPHDRLDRDAGRHGCRRAQARGHALIGRVARRPPFPAPERQPFWFPEPEHRALERRAPEYPAIVPTTPWRPSTKTPGRPDRRPRELAADLGASGESLHPRLTRPIDAERDAPRVSFPFDSLPN